MIALEHSKRRVMEEPDGAFEAPTGAEKTWIWTRQPASEGQAAGVRDNVDDSIVRRGRCGRPEVIPPDLVVKKAPDYMASSYPGERWSQFFFKWYAQENDTWGEDYKRGAGKDPDFGPKLPATLILDIDREKKKTGEEDEEIIGEDLKV